MNSKNNRCVVFVGGPFSAALKFDDAENIIGFDIDLQVRFEGVYKQLRKRGAYIVSSHLAEDFGADVHEQTLVQRDNAWLKGCSAYIAILPFNTSTNEPYRSDGTFVEIGMAIGLNKPCILLIENPEHPSWSYYVRNLSSEPGVMVYPYKGEKNIVDKCMDCLMDENPLRQSDNVNIDDATVLKSLLYGGKDGHQVTSKQRNFEIPVGVLSSWFDTSLQNIVLERTIFDETGSPVLVITGGGGELPYGLYKSGATKKIDVRSTNQFASEILPKNLTRTEGKIRLLTNHPSAGYNMIICHLPPLYFSGKNDHPFQEILDLTRKAISHAIFGRTKTRLLIFSSSNVNNVLEWLVPLNVDVKLVSGEKSVFNFFLTDPK